MPCIISLSLLAVSELNGWLKIDGDVCEITDKSELLTVSTKVGRISVPEFATAAETMAICKGVATVSP